MWAGRESVRLRGRGGRARAMPAPGSHRERVSFAPHALQRCVLQKQQFWLLSLDVTTDTAEPALVPCHAERVILAPLSSARAGVLCHFCCFGLESEEKTAGAWSGQGEARGPSREGRPGQGRDVPSCLGSESSQPSAAAPQAVRTGVNSLVLVAASSGIQVLAPGGQ